MDIRVMEYVMAVSEECSFTKAAARLCIAQPSISQQITKLETNMGMSLFHRQSKSVTLTSDGIRFVAQARKILQLHQDLVDEMRERRQGMGETLCIGTTAITGGRLLPRLLSAFHEAHPIVHPQLVEESTERVTELVVRGQIDLAILPLPIDHSELETVQILTEPLYLAVPTSKQPWMTEDMWHVIQEPTSSGSSFVTFSTAPFVALKQGFGFRSTLLALCANEGFQPDIAYETSSMDTAQSLVAYGSGITVVPEMVAHRYVPPIPKYLKLASKPTRSLVFAYPRNRYVSMAAQAFMDLASGIVSSAQ